jgi:hypothetical protein
MINASVPSVKVAFLPTAIVASVTISLSSIIAALSENGSISTVFQGHRKVFRQTHSSIIQYGVKRKVRLAKLYSFVSLRSGGHDRSKTA